MHSKRSFVKVQPLTGNSASSGLFTTPSVGKFSLQVPRDLYEQSSASTHRTVHLLYTHLKEIFFRILFKHFVISIVFLQASSIFMTHLGLLNCLQNLFNFQ